MSAASPNSAPPTIGFVILIAALMGINALAVDVMLPALSEIGQDLNVSDGNKLQWIIAIYMAGFGATQFLFGPLSDSFGRRPVLIAGLVTYGVLAAIAAFSSSFSLLLIARFLQGVASSAVRVTALAVVRDKFKGTAMSKVMSLSMMIFLAVPIFAPMIGQAVLVFGNWHEIFILLVVYSAAVLFFTLSKLGETLPIGKRKPFTLTDTAQSFKYVLTHFESLGYTVAGGLGMGMLMAYVISGAQIFAAFGVGDLFPYLFGIGASGFAVAALVNSRVVEKLGPAGVIEKALVGSCIVMIANLTAENFIDYGVVVFLMFQFVVVFFIGLITPNLQALSMEAMESVAGTASSVQGTIMTLVAAGVGTAIGQAFDGSPEPLIIGYVCCALAQTALVHATRHKADRSRRMRVS